MPLILIAFTLGGCRSGKDVSNDPNQSKKPDASNNTHVKVTFGKPGSDIRLVRHFYSDADGVEVKRETEYSDGRMLYETLYTSGPAAGTPKEASATFPNSKTIQAHAVYNKQQQIVSYEQYYSNSKLYIKQIRLSDGTIQTRYFQSDGKTLSVLRHDYPDKSYEISSFYSDGKTLLMFKRLGANGVLEETSFQKDGKTPTLFRRVEPDKTETVTVFQEDGKSLSRRYTLHPNTLQSEIFEYRKTGNRLFSFQSFHADYSSDITYYRYDGKTIWAKIKKLSRWNNNLGSDVSEIEVYKPDGTLDQKRVFNADGSMDITVYQNAGAKSSVGFHQHWSNLHNSWWKNWNVNYRLSSVEKLRGNGNVEQKYEYDSNGKLHRVTTYNADGTKSVRYFRSSNETLEKEEQYNAAGKLTKTTQFDEKKNIHEKVDAELTQMPAYDDPTLWNVPRD